MVEKLPGGYHDGYLAFWSRYLAADGSFCDNDGCLILPTWNHLWYLAYLWPYTMSLLSLMPALKRAGSWLEQPSSRAAAAWLLPSVPILWLIFVQLWLAPRYPTTHALVDDWTVHAESLPLFMLGYLLAISTWFWDCVKRWRWTTLALAVLAIAIELSLRWLGRHPPAEPLPAWLLRIPWYGIERIARAGYTWLALLAIFGWARTLLDRPFRWLPYCTEAVFPWYVLHQTLIVVLAYWLLPLHLGPIMEPSLVIGGTIAGCLLLHECLIRRVPLLRPLFGLRRKENAGEPQSAAASSAPPA